MTYAELRPGDVLLAHDNMSVSWVLVMLKGKSSLWLNLDDGEIDWTSIDDQRLVDLSFYEVVRGR